MDRSIDSIGSCSLDVDADSTDFSDTSGSLNITPSSAKDITKEFTANFKERCKLTPGLKGLNNFQQTTTILDKSGNITTILTPPAANAEKKPSYLNLACCVNGYSNLTTYDSKLRQNINKSREVSPIRPSENTLQYCKNYKNFLSPPFYVFIGRPDPPMETKHEIITHQNTKMSNTSITKITKTTHRIGDYDTVDKSTALGETQKSFIQQRVERLYGVGAIEQGVYSPKKIVKTPPKIYTNSSETDKTSEAFEIKTTLNGHNGVDLPVLRHLRPEFRAQLPIVSPKKIKSDLSQDELASVITTTNDTINNLNSHTVENDSKDIKHIQNGNNLELKNMTEAIKSVDNNSDESKATVNCENVTKNGEAAIDAKYFLNLLKTEQNRLLDMAANVEKDMELLLDNPEISEEILGYLRSAAGKARLLVSQKMKQFEGLCHSNLNQKEGEKYNTTVEDLQGFWDMVNLQVDHIDALFKEIEALKQSDWKNLSEQMLSNSSSTIGPHSLKRPVHIRSSAVKSLETNGATTNKKLSSDVLAANQKREAQRKQLLEFKRKNKMAIAAANQQTTDNSENVLFLNGNSS